MIARWEQLSPSRASTAVPPDPEPPPSLSHECDHGHVLARLNGFGHTVIPRYPYEFRLVDEGVRVTHQCEGRTFGLVLAPDAEMSLKLADGTGEASEVADIAKNGLPGPWLIETSMWSCVWPDGFRCASAGFAAFVLLGDHGEMIYVQTPEKMPQSFREFAAPRQQVVSVDESERTIVLEYAHNSQSWKQGHYILSWQPPIAITAQAPATYFLAAESAAKIVGESIVPDLEHRADG